MGKRIEYIDAMRGLAMLLVVIGHVHVFSFNHTDNVLFQILSLEIQIPLFFMVSGFLVKIPQCKYWSFCKKKAFLLCVPASIFMTINIWINNHDSITVLGSDMYKDGYWFTFSLFEFTVLFSALKFISRKLRLDINADHLFVLIATIIIVSIVTIYIYIENDSFIIPLLGLRHIKSFPYFIFGTILAERNILRNNMSFIKQWKELLLFICFLLHIYIYKNSSMDYYLIPIQYKLLLIPATILGLFVLLQAFKQYESWSSSWIGKKLQKMGRYTLDIYFIHFFFIPKSLSMIGDWFKVNPNPIIEYALAMLIAALIISASLLVGRIIRLSPTLAHWLLGEKKIIE
jgi:surface polysaccharide O-acyltransferase-like enzyme